MKRHPLLCFWLLGFLLSWLAWVPLAMALSGQLTLPVSLRQVQLYGAYGPAVAALVITLVIGGVDGLQGLFSRFLVWRVGWRWYVAALLLPAGLSLLTTMLHLMSGGGLPDFTRPPIYYYSEWSPWLVLVPLFLRYIAFDTAVGEELAWRGFGLQRLQQRYSPLTASVMIAFLWVLWNLPLTWAQVPPGVRVDFVLVRLLGAIPAAILITWIYNKTGGSLLLVLLFNTATKMTDLFVTPCMGSTLLPAIAYWLVAASILYMGGARALQGPPSGPVERREGSKALEVKSASALAES